MKENESFDNTLFMKVICVVAAVVLVCVVIFVIVGAIDGGSQPNTDTGDDYEQYTFAPDTSVASPDDTSEASDTTATPPDTTAPDTTSAGNTTAPETGMTPAGNLTILPESSAILGETEDMGQEYINDIIFLGDSTTYAMIPYAVLADGKDTKQVWTPVNGTLTLDQAVKKKIKYPETGEEITIAEAAATKLPKYLIITLGVNGVSFMNEEQFITEYTKVVQAIQAASPTTKIILQSIFPVGKDYDKLTSINNEKITLANTWVLKVAEACGIKYLNTASVLHDEEGWLYPSFHSGDGMHFNADGYKVVLDYILTHGYVD